MEFLDQLTKESIDFQYVLNRLNTKTPYGKIYKDKMRPYLRGEEEKLTEELKKVESLYQSCKDIKVYGKDKPYIPQDKGYKELP